MRNNYLHDEIFTINNYMQRNPFANFLPGVAGKEGIPLWAFYVNRGQGISGFGVDNKKHPIMPFTSANKAYENVSINGFRTFLKVNGSYYEPFSSYTNHKHVMNIERTAFSIEEINNELNLKISVRYFGLPESSLPALVRQVSIENIGTKQLEIKMLDGLAEILPSKVASDNFKNMSNVLASWMDVKHVEERIAYNVLRGSTGDTSEVNSVEDGNFYIGFDETGLLPIMVDLRTVFGQNSAKTHPEAFLNYDWNTFRKQPQITANKIPCAFVNLERTLPPGEQTVFYAVSGAAPNIELLKSFIPTIMCYETIQKQRFRAKEIIENMLDDVTTKTAFPLFDAYIKQNYLDNFLRGGYPEIIADKPYHLYSRRHGDLERDYNQFSLLPEYYSQGSGNFRDVCQNRRLDSFFEPKIGAFNIKMFASLIQLDGYNPLTVYGVVYRINEESDVIPLINKHFPEGASSLYDFVREPFTPGGFIRHIESHNYQASHEISEYLSDFLSVATTEFNASFGEGFWIDHFAYIIDLVESYQSIYPDKMEQLLFEDEAYRYYDSAITILKKEEKTVLNKQGNVRQYGSLLHFDQEKIKRLNINPYGTNWVRQGNQIFTTNLFTKLLIIVLNKHSQLDPDMLGIEMEAEKPGWNDAMNGLPGLFGSGISETIELLRMAEFLIKYPPKHAVNLPKAVFELFQSLKVEHTYQMRIKARETYRDAIRFGLNDAIVPLDRNSVVEYIEQLIATLKAQLLYLYQTYDGILPTFLYYDVTGFEKTKKQCKNNGYTLVQPKAYKRHALPMFLEAPARLFKTTFDKEKLQNMHQKIMTSELYDEPLKMFKTSVPLDFESHEIGRIQAFNKGWLERESNFLHMTYKYLLGLLKAGLYEEYYHILDDNLVCFMDANIYGRSTLENSSFIATSNNPDKYVHGQGFFARLSGSTIEVLNMWSVMMTGGNPFIEKDEELIFKLEPKLHRKYFDASKKVTFTLMKNLSVTYVNESLEHTFNRCDIHSIVLTKGGVDERYHPNELRGNLACNIRDRLYDKMIVYMNRK